jgi:hypothetical protein
METPPPLPYAQRIAKVQRLAKSATFRHDIKLAVRELCEALTELSGALMDRELGGATGEQSEASESKPPA